MTIAVTKESLAARIAELESGARSLKEDYTLAAYKMLLATMEAEPVAYIPESQLNLLERVLMVDADLSKVQRFDETPLYRHAQPVVPVVPGWIPVSEQMPEIRKHWLDVTVIITISGEKYGSEALYCSDGNFRWGRDEQPIEDVTHWMPLPYAPQEVK